MKLAIYALTILCMSSSLAQPKVLLLTCDESRLLDEAIAGANQKLNKQAGMPMFEYREIYRAEMDEAARQWEQCSWNN